MVSFSIVRNVAARSRALLLNATQKQQSRPMSLGGHHGPPPEWTGVDKVVRKYFPEDYQRTSFCYNKIPNSVYNANLFPHLKQSPWLFFQDILVFIW